MERVSGHWKRGTLVDRQSRASLAHASGYDPLTMIPPFTSPHGVSCLRIGVFCSGGDAPGMNACVRSVVRRAVSEGHEVVGILRGYQGILDEEFFIDRDGLPRMSARSVSGWSRHGGAFLYSSRSDEFRTEKGQQ